MLTDAAPLAAAIFVVTIALVITRPGRFTEARAAILGAALMVAAGQISPADSVANVAGHWNVLFFFLGLTGTAAVAERSGAFEALAGLAAQVSGGRPRRLLIAVVFAGAIVAAVLSNDAAALVLTPVVYVIVTRFGLEPMPYVLACTFVADAASLALPTGNPVNVIVTDRLGESPAGLIPILFPAAVASVLALLICLLFIYRRVLPARSPLPLKNGSWASWREIPRPLLVGFGVAVGAFAVASLANLPLGPAMTAVWIFLLALERAGGRQESPLDGIGWSLIAFVGAMGLLVGGLSNAGITSWLANIILGSAHDSPILAMLAAAVSSALGANAVNNLPAAFVLADAIHGAGLPAASAHAAAIGTIIGADLGPNLTPVGSVATLLWFVLLRQRGLVVSSWSYIRIGLIVTPVTIVAALAVAVLLGGAR